MAVSRQALGENEGSTDATTKKTTRPWPVYDRATTAADRARAVATVLDRAGLGARVPRWRAVAMLGAWFEAGWSVMGLLHAIDHHPDQPDRSRDDAARDPLRILGPCLAPWRGRAADLPAGLAAVDGPARRARAAATAHDLDCGRPSTSAALQRPRAHADPAVRAAACAELERVLTRPGRRR